MKPAASETPDARYSLSEFGTGECFELAYGDGTRFVIDGAARRIWATYSPPLTMDDLCVYLRGPVMGFVLRRRGLTALHASAVVATGRVIAFCGQSETGKSTTAAALALRGAAVLSDDIAALREENSVFLVEPGYPRVCLWPDMVGDLLGVPDALPRLTPNWEKCFLALDNRQARFEDEPRPLGIVYLLAPRSMEASAPRVEEVAVREAVMELVRNTYMNWLLDRDQRAAEFDTLARLATQIPLRRIVPHSDPARLDALCDLILADAERWSNTPAPTASLAVR